MSGLQEAFYIVALVYMGLSFIIIFGVLVAVLIIRHKIVQLEATIREKVELVTTVGERAGEVIGAVKKLTKRKAS